MRHQRRAAWLDSIPFSLRERLPANGAVSPATSFRMNTSEGINIVDASMQIPYSTREQWRPFMDGRSARVNISVPKDKSIVRVPDVVLKSVGFVGQVLHRDGDKITDVDWQGTGFFVSVPGRIMPRITFHAFVTAKHIAEKLKDKNVCFAVNTTSGGVATLTNTQGSWWTHPTDETADVAILPFKMTPDLDIVTIRTTDFLTREAMAARNIGIGDEVFMTGLFDLVPSIYAGKARNMPIVRHGNIAMLPEDRIQTEYGYADVFLIEARSIGGISGSPVFARQTVAVPVKIADEETWLHGLGGMHLIGLMHGHWDVRESEANEPFPRYDKKRGVNMGVAIVVPAAKIIETIDRPELVEMREGYEKKLWRDSSPTMD